MRLGPLSAWKRRFVQGLDLKSLMILIHILHIQIARVQSQRANLISEHVGVSKASRRALHDLEMASLDLWAAENRRKLADIQLEKARAGVLGIDYVSPASI